MCALDAKVVPTSRPFAPTHPDRLAAAAALAGLSSTPPDAARVLELGCGDGGNIIPMAAFLPGASFVGVDRSQEAIDNGREVVSMLGLRNVELRCEAFADLDESLGEFDYIIVHGVISWVSEDDRRRVLELCRDCLSPTGLAVVTYNVRPGWNLRRTLRDLLLPVAASGDSAGAVERARDRARLLGEALEVEHPWAALLRAELSSFAAKPDDALLLDELAGYNVAFTLRELAELVAGFDLALVDELLAGPFGIGIDASARERLYGAGLRGLELEEAIDVASCRFFRASLLCRQGRYQAKGGAPEPSRGWLFAAEIRSKAEEPLLGPGKPLSFELPDGTEIATDHPLLKAALLELAQAWPRGLQLDELLERSRAALLERGLAGGAHSSSELDEALVNDLMRLARDGRVELWVRNPVAQSPQEPGERPRVHPLARFQATLAGFVTTPRHQVAGVDPLTRHLVRVLDGEHELDDLVEETLRAVARRELEIQSEAGDVESVEALQGQVRPMVARAVMQLHALGLIRD